MALDTRARFDGVPIWRQLAQEYETAALELACFRGDVVPAARTEASVVDGAWGAADARYQTEDDVKAYARKMLEAAQRLYDNLHGGPKIVICVEDASDPQTRVYCCMNMCDKLQVAIDAYTNVKHQPTIKEIQYGGVPFADNRVYRWNTPDALAMKNHDVIRVFHYMLEPTPQVDHKHIKRLDVCILGAEGLVEETFVHYTCWIQETFDKYARDFCTRKGLQMSKVRFMNAGNEIDVEGRYYVSKFVRPVCKPEAGPVLIYVLPKPEFEADPEECFVPAGCAEEQEQGVSPLAGARMPRLKRRVVKMNL